MHNSISYFTRPRLSLRDKILFIKRLGIMLSAGTPILEALAIMMDASNAKGVSLLSTTMRDSLAQGKSLSIVMQSHSPLFDTFTIAMVKVGEVSGTLSQNLNFAAEALQAQDVLRKKIIGAMIYPIVISLATIGIVAVLMLYIFPKITPIFSSFHQSLPLSTRTVMWLSLFLQHHWLAILIVFFGLITLYNLLYTMKSVKLFSDRMVLHVPLIGSLSHFYNTATIARTLSLLLRGDVEIIKAVTITSACCTNLLYREKMLAMCPDLARGISLSSVFKTYPFPPMLSQMLKVSDKTGQSASMLAYVAGMYEQEINDLTQRLTTLMEPILMVVMGIIVGFIAVSIIEPIYGITQNLSQTH